MERALVKEEDVRSWFATVHEYLQKNDLLTLDFSRIFNLDESAFILVAKGKKVIVKRGSNSVYKVAEGNDKESLTVLYTGSEGGAMTPPMVLGVAEKSPIKNRQENAARMEFWLD